MSKNNLNFLRPCVIGLGYVGLPILLKLQKKYDVLGYDINKNRIRNLINAKDDFNEINKKELIVLKNLLTDKFLDLKSRNLYIITVPTPIYKNKSPDLSHLKNVCMKLSKKIKQKDIIIFESTVYPGITDNFCKSILEKNSKLKDGKDFFVGYSPERVNPGDKSHSLKMINKILAYPYSFKKKEIVKLYSNLGKKIIFTKKIREAETAKVIENIQRDVNIGLINEIYLVCKKMKIDFNKVMKLASTKWNFIKFKPGLVGGHCLPVDPYYFSHVSKKYKLKSKITLAGRYINDEMQNFIYKEISKKINKHKNKKILFCGLTYKENVADLRNSLALNIFKKFKKKKFKIFGYDPLIDDKVSKKTKIYNSLKNFRDYDVYIPITKHKKIEHKIKKLPSKKIVLNIFD